MALTKVTGHVVLPTTNIEFHNTKSTGIVTFTHTSNATSSTTGALQITGGVGIAQDLFVGGQLSVGGTITYEDVDNINSVGIITANAGIVLQDYIFHKGDTNTSVGFPSNDTIDLITAGTPRIRIMSGGNVGINTTTPDTQLEVFGGSTSIQVGNQSGTGRFGADGTSTKLGSHSNHQLDLFTNGSSNTRLRITNDGKVQIGLPGNSVSLPGAVDTVSIRARDEGNLHIRDIGNLTSSPAGTGVGIDVLNNASNAVKDLCIRASTLIFKHASDETLRITSDGKLVVGATAATNGSIAEFSKSVASGAAGCHITVENTSTNSVNNTAGIHLKTDQGVAKFFTYRATETYLQSRSGGASDLILQANGASNMRLQTNSAERLRIDSSGRVGVNQSSFATSDTMFSVSETTGHCEIGIISKNDSGVVINMGDTDSYNQGRIKYDNSDNSLTFRTTGNDRLRITSDGSMGLGTNSPVARFHVHNSGTGSGDHAYAYFTTGDTGATASDGLTIGVNATATAVVNFREAGNLSFGTSSTERLRINSSGNVNIGPTADPRKRLDITGPDGRSGASPGNSDTALIIDNDGGNGSILEFLSDNNAYGRIFFTDTDASNRGQIVYEHGNDAFQFSTAGTQRLRIDNVGRVQVNQTSNVTGTAKLEVMGTGDNTYPQYSFAIGVADTQDYNVSNGSGMGIGFSYKHNTAGSYALGCGIRGFKENTTNNDYAGAMAFYTRPNGAGAGEKARLSSAGTFGVGTVNPDSNYKIDCNGRLRIGDGNAGHRIQFSRSGLGDELVLGVDGYGNSNNNEATIQSSINSARPLVFATGNTERFRITESGNHVQTGGYYYLNNPNGSIFFDNNTGGYGGNAGIGIAQVANYHVNGTSPGDLVMAAKNQKKIIFATAPNNSGGISASSGGIRMQMSKEGYVTKPGQPKALVKIYSTTTLSSGKVTNWASPIFNTANLWDASNKRFVAPTEGLYLVGGNFRIGAPGSIRVVRFMLNAYNTSGTQMAAYGGGVGGTLNSDGGSSGYDHPYVSFTNVIYLQTGQYLELHLAEVATQHTTYIQVSNEQSAMWCVLLQ